MEDIGEIYLCMVKNWGNLFMYGKIGICSEIQQFKYIQLNNLVCFVVEWIYLFFWSIEI